PLLRLFFNDACLYGVGAPFFLLLTFRVKAEPVPKRSLRFGSWLIAFLIAAFFVETSATVSFNVIDTVTQLLGFHTSDRIQNVSTNVPLWAVFLFNVVIPPLGEEFLFRRCLLDRLRPYGEKSAALISAFAFALFHINAYQFSYTLLLGLLLAYLYLKTGRLRYCSAIHAGVNLVFGVFPELVDRYGNTEWLSRALSNGSFDLSELTGATLWGTLFYACYLLLINGLVIAGLIFFIRKIGRVRWAQGSCHLSGGRTVLRLVRNPFVWIYVSVTVLLALYYLLLSTLS
ncbi:MAG: CPBP family intramembrane metalloprotease, partial [Clostridia bacterium]|nr:CPBP family intramembrane metalloprotease [Clostridia bacterium]